jgi:hypothetical protein
MSHLQRRTTIKVLYLFNNSKNSTPKHKSPWNFFQRAFGISALVMLKQRTVRLNSFEGAINKYHIVQELLHQGWPVALKDWGKYLPVSKPSE